MRWQTITDRRVAAVGSQHCRLPFDRLRDHGPASGSLRGRREGCVGRRSRCRRHGAKRTPKQPDGEAGTPKLNMTQGTGKQ